MIWLPGGTTLTFTDSTTPVAVASSYVISSWKLDANGDWVFNADGNSYRGDGTAYGNSDTDVFQMTTTSSGGRTYSYTATGDGEYIRLGYHCGNFSTVTHPTVTINFK